jgi:hypothetical protein
VREYNTGEINEPKKAWQRPFAISDTGAKSIYKANDTENQFQNGYILLSA